MGSQATSDYRRNRKVNLVHICGDKCCICGYNKSIAALEFHHINPADKEYSISSKGTCRNIRTDIAEIKKCILLCANCHREVENHEYDNVDLWQYQVFNEKEAEKLIQETDAKLKMQPRYCSICGKPITRDSKSGKCVDCVRINPNRPSREELKDLIYNFSFEEIGRKYSITGNSVKKWCKALNLPCLRSEINKISPEDWKLV